MHGFRHRTTHSPAVQHSTWRWDVRWLSLSRGISMAGAEAGYIALLALAWHLTGSASQASIVLLASVVARTVGAPLAGWIGDYVNRRAVLIVSELVIALAFAAMAMAQSIPQLLAICFVHAFAGATCAAALDASVASLAPRAQLSKANSTLGIARTAGHMLGPVLGGLAVAGFGARAAFVAGAVASIIAGMMVLAIRGNVGGASSRARSGSAGGSAGSSAGSGESSDADRGMMVGLRVLAQDPVLRLLVLGWSGMCVAFAFVTAAELPLAAEFGVDEAGLGMIVSAWCAGSLVGAWCSRRVKVEQHGVRVLAIAALACGAVFAAAGVVPAFWCVLALMAIGGCAMALAEVVEMTIIQQRVEDGVRARVLAAYGGLAGAIWGFNLALAGLFVEATSPGAAYVYAGVWCVISSLGFVGLGVATRRREHAEMLQLLRPRHDLECLLIEEEQLAECA